MEGLRGEKGAGGVSLRGTNLTNESRYSVCREVRNVSNEERSEGQRHRWWEERTWEGVGGHRRVQGMVGGRWGRNR